MPGDKLRVNSTHQTNAHQNHDIHLSLNELQYPLHQRQQDALAECDRLIAHFKKESTQHKRGFQRLRFFGISLSLLTTVLSALAASQQLGEYEWAVPAVSGLATLFVTLLSQTSAQKIWIRSSSIQQNLQTEKFLYLQSAGNYAAITNEEDQIRYFSRRVMEIWSEGHKHWEQNITNGVRLNGSHTNGTNSNNSQV